MGVQALAPNLVSLMAGPKFDVAMLWCGTPPTLAGNADADKVQDLYQSLLDASDKDGDTGASDDHCPACVAAQEIFIDPFKLTLQGPYAFLDAQDAPRRQVTDWIYKTGPPLGARSPPVV